MEKYLINENTLAIIPYKGRSRVIEKYIMYEVEKIPSEIVDESCKFYGSSLIGRIESTEYLIGVKYKCPVIVSEQKKIIFFPTKSHRISDCVWFNAISIKSYYKNNENNLEILLINNKKIILKLSNNIFSNQILKSSRLESVIKSKKR